MFVIVIAAGLGCLIIFGVLYRSSKSLGFWVPKAYVPVETVLNLALPDGFEIADTGIGDIREIEKLDIKGQFEGKYLKIIHEEQPVIISAIYWPYESEGLEFWKRFYRTVSRRHIRIKAFRNNLWKPRFVTGRFGRKAPYDITAWYEAHWFFLISVSTGIKDFSRLKGDLRTRMIERMRQVSY